MMIEANGPVEVGPDDLIIPMVSEARKKSRFTFGTRILGFNVWMDTQAALGHVGDFVEHHQWKLLLCGPGNNAVGVALAGDRTYPSLYVFLGPRHVGIDRFPDDG